MVESLGKAFSSQDMADMLGCDVRFVRRHYVALGGVRLGVRKIVFFEKEIARAIQAQRRESEKTVGWSGRCEREGSPGHICHQTGGQIVGNRSGSDVSLVDTHNLFG